MRDRLKDGERYLIRVHTRGFGFVYYIASWSEELEAFKDLNANRDIDFDKVDAIKELNLIELNEVRQNGQ